MSTVCSKGGSRIQAAKLERLLYARSMHWALLLACPSSDWPLIDAAHLKAGLVEEVSVVMGHVFTYGLHVQGWEAGK